MAARVRVLRSRGARVSWLGFACALLATSCTLPSRSSRTIGPSPSVEAPSSADVGGDRLVVLHDDGNLATLGPDGSDPLPLTIGAGPDLIVQQPVASPDGRSVAWVEARGGEGKVVIESRDGSDRREIGLQIVPFFLEWDPTSSRIAYLGSTPPSGIGLGVIDDAVTEPRDHPVGGGQPLYFSWSPNGTHMLVHVGLNQLGRTDLTHGLDPIGAVPGTFQAPVWLPDGRLVYVTREGKTQHLVVAGNGDRHVIATFRGGVLFDASPDGARLAYRVDRTNGSQEGVFVTDLRSGRTVRATTRETTAFFWSPRGDTLLLMAVEPKAPVKQTHRWWLWDGHARPVSEPFLPSPTFFRNYVPFFDQYAQALTPWAPDGSAFAFAGLIRGRAGIWVQPVDGSNASLVTDGEFVAWLPPPR